MSPPRGGKLLGVAHPVPCKHAVPEARRPQRLLEVMNPA